MDLSVKFKEGVDPDQVKYLCPRLLKVLEALAHMFDCAGYDTMITSMVRPTNSIGGESGVHATGRALDCKHVARTKVAASLTKLDCSKLAGVMNIVFRRNDQKMTCLYHDAGMGWHFHLQVPAGKDYEDLNGHVPGE